MISSFISHSPSRDDRDAFALCIMGVVSVIAAMKFNCSVKKKQQLASFAAAIPAICVCVVHYGWV